MRQSNLWCEINSRPNDDRIRMHCRAASAELGARLARAGHLGEGAPAPARVRPAPPPPPPAVEARPQAPARKGVRYSLPLRFAPGLRPATPAATGPNLASRLARRACWVPGLKGWRHAAAHVARCHGLTLAEAFAGRGTHAVWRARAHVYFALRVGFGFSLPEIGGRLDRHHSSVMKGLRAHAKRLPDV